MVSRGWRVLAVVLAAVVVALAFGTAWRTAAAPPSASCAAPCASVAASPDEVPCLRDPACGGHTSPAPASWAAEVAPVVALAVAPLFATIRRRRRGAGWPRLLAVGGLYRPPRLSV